MSKPQFNSATLRQELKNNEDEMLVTSVREVFEGWRKKVGHIAVGQSCIRSSAPTSTLQNAAVPHSIQPSRTIECHSRGWSRSISHSFHTDAVVSINKDDLTDFIMFVDKYLSGIIVPLKDVLKHVVPIVKDLGFSGKVILKTENGADYVIVKGYAGKRSFVTGTRYLSTHPKMMQLAIGKVGLKSTIRGGGVLTVFITIGIELVKLLLGEKELRECGVTIASDIVKIGISVVLGEAAAMLVAGTATVGAFAVGPIIVAIAVGIVATMLLDGLDHHYNITDRVVAMIKKVGENIINGTRNELNRASDNIYEGIRHWIWHESGGFDIANPMGG